MKVILGYPSQVLVRAIVYSILAAVSFNIGWMLAAN